MITRADPLDERILIARRAAINAIVKELVEHCRDGCLLGIGTGSTVTQFLEEISGRDEVKILVKSSIVCSSIDTCIKLSRYGLMCLDPLAIMRNESIDIYIDSADEVDSRCFMIKGGGGALLREKVLTELARVKLFMIDYEKLSPLIGTKKSLPIEVIPVAYPLVAKRLRVWGIPFDLRMSSDKKGPVMTDNGNFLVDVHTGPMNNPEEIDRNLKLIPGVAETGLFYPTHVSKIIVGYHDGSIKELYPK